MAAVLAATFLTEMHSPWATYRSAQDSYQSINHTRSALNLVLEMQDGVRGYLLTGDYRFMGPYYAAQDRVLGTLEQMLDTIPGSISDGVMVNGTEVSSKSSYHSDLQSQPLTRIGLLRLKRELAVSNRRVRLL
jgi:CHASE3 domain